MNLIKAVKENVVQQREDLEQDIEKLLIQLEEKYHELSTLTLLERVALLHSLKTASESNGSINGLQG